MRLPDTYEVQIQHKVPNASPYTKVVDWYSDIEDAQTLVLKLWLQGDLSATVKPIYKDGR